MIRGPSFRTPVKRHSTGHQSILRPRSGTSIPIDIYGLAPYPTQEGISIKSTTYCSYMVQVPYCTVPDVTGCRRRTWRCDTESKLAIRRLYVPFPGLRFSVDGDPCRSVSGSRSAPLRTSEGHISSCGSAQL